MADPSLVAEETHNKLTSAATSFVERYARQFGTPIAAPDGWQHVDGAGVYEFKRETDTTFKCVLPWISAFSPDRVFRFHVLPGVASGLTFKISSQEDITGKALSLSVQSTVTGSNSFYASNLLQKVTEGETSTVVVEKPPDVDDLAQDSDWQPIDG